MVDTRKRRMAVFLFFLLALGAVLLFSRITERETCMGVPFLSEEEQAELGEYVYYDASRELQYNGQRAAVDLTTSTVYIAQDISAATKAADLQGTLRLLSPSLRMSFAPDEAFEELAAAVEQGHVFKLNIAHGSNKYMQYDLVFTTLPVLRLDGEVIGKNEKNKDICKGDMCLWNPADPEIRSYSVKTSQAQWHVRGGWSATLLKTPFKLDLKKKSGTPRNLSLAGLGADDDWILNPMNLDDTKLKEKLFMGLWNRRAEQVEWNEQMSEGAYVEVVINQEYWGVFQLQRRIDNKFLNLGADDILLKSGSLLSADTVETAYEIIWSGLPEQETYALVQEFFAGRDGELLNMDNFLDVNVFMQWASAKDNVQKNMFYLLRKEEGDYRMYLLPWDTDMSWGTVWRDEAGGFVYDFEESRQLVVLRREYDWMQQYRPDLDRQMAKRWFELRENLLTMENMTRIAQQHQALLDASGAQKRDTEQWGLYYEGQDSLENLHKSMEARLAFVDAYYSQYLQ